MVMGVACVGAVSMFGQPQKPADPRVHSCYCTQIIFHCFKTRPGIHSKQNKHSFFKIDPFHSLTVGLCVQLL